MRINIEMRFEAPNSSSFWGRFSRLQLPIHTAKEICSLIKNNSNSTLSFFYICIWEKWKWKSVMSDSSATLWTVAHQAPLSMEWSRQEFCSGLPFPSPGDLPNQGLNPGFLYCRQICSLLSQQGCPISVYITRLFSL